MLEGSQVPAIWQDASNQCLFEFNTKEPRLNLAPLPFASSFELESGLDMGLDLSLNCARSSKEFEMDFSLSINRLNDFVASTNKLNVLPEKIDFSELLSFQTYVNSNPMQQSVAELVKSVEADQKISGSNLMLEVQQIPDRNENISIADDSIEEPKIQRHFGLLSLLSKNSCDRTHFMKTLFDDNKSNRIGLVPQENIRSTPLINFIKVIMSETDSSGTSSESMLRSDYISVSKLLLDNPKSLELPSLVYNELSDTCQSSEESSVNLEDSIEETPSETVETFYKSVSKKHVSRQFDNDAEIENILNVNQEEGQKSIEKETTNLCQDKDTDESLKLAIKPDNRLKPNKEILLESFHEIVDANEIRKSGVQIFKKPTKLFVFDCLKEWKKRGEGQIEIWKLDRSDSGVYYMLLWDKLSEKLLIHMRLDSKWSIDFLANCTNSCRWSHFNYANCPKGVRERLACRFRDSDVAAQFVGVVAKCVENSRLLLE